MTLYQILLIATTLLCGLISGLYYGYSVSVNGGLGKLEDRPYLQAMQSINRVILNPWFFVSFFGPVLLLPLITWLNARQAYDNVFYLLLAASILFVAGNFVLTAIGNVPLNNGLDKLHIASANDNALREARLKYERPWNRFHMIRTAACFVAFLLLCIVLVLTQ